MRAREIARAALAALVASTVVLGGVRSSLAEEVAAAARGKLWIEPLTGMRFVRVPEGCFAMGRAEPVRYREEIPGHPLQHGVLAFIDESPKHQVCVDAFWLGESEVSSGQWQQVMGGATPAQPERPAAEVSWDDARRFVERLTAKQSTGVRFRLPTEAEWEYACRAGSQKEDPVAAQNEFSRFARYGSEDGERYFESAPVRSLEPNAFGLYDMLGNVWEWVQDAYRHDAYRRHELFGPVVEAKAGPRVIRGGSFRSEPMHVRCTRRGNYPPQAALPTIGLRLVRLP